MEILIPLPSSSSINTYKELNSYLKQLELAVHYAQKSVESAEKNGIPVTENAFIDFRHPGLSQEQQDNIYVELQNIELKISLN